MNKKSVVSFVARRCGPINIPDMIPIVNEFYPKMAPLDIVKVLDSVLARGDVSCVGKDRNGYSMYGVEK